MSPAPLRHPLLGEAGIEHGFGVRDAAEPPGVLRPVQVHGAAVVRAEQLVTQPALPADAVVSTQRGVAVGIVTADCVPVLAAAADGGAVAAIHAGWRGLAAGVIEAGIAALREAGADRTLAAIGPCIGACCYEVDAPVLSALRARYPRELERALRPGRPGRAQLDLSALTRCALEAAGLDPNDVGNLPGACTACDSERFHSFRRDGPRSGRLLHFVRA